MPLIVNRFDDWIEYTPDADDNRLIDEPMTVEIQSMSTAEYKAVQRSWGPKLQGKNAIGRAQKMVEAIIKKRVRNIRNLFVVDASGNELEVTDPEEMMSVAPPYLIDDLFEAITNASHLSKGTRKNLQSQSDSYSREIQPSRGTAASASERAPSKPANPVDKHLDNSGAAPAKLALT